LCLPSVSYKMNIPLMANLFPVFSSAATSLATKFTMTVASVAEKTDPVSIVALICCCQILFAASVYVLMTRKVEPMVINLNVSNVPEKKEEEEPVAPMAEEERPAAPVPLAPIRVPKPRHSLKDLHEYLADGQPIRHRVRGHQYFYGSYNAGGANIICTDGTVVKSLSGFAVHNIKQANPNLAKPQADGWARCEVQIEDGSWVKANTLTI